MSQTPKSQQGITVFGKLQSGNMGDFLGRSYRPIRPFSSPATPDTDLTDQLGFQPAPTLPISIVRTPAIVCESHVVGSTGGNFISAPMGMRMKSSNYHEIVDDSSCVEYYFYIELDKKEIAKEGEHPIEFIFFSGNHPITVSETTAKVNDKERAITKSGAVNYVQVKPTDYQQSDNGKYKVTIDVGGTINDPNDETAYSLVFNVLSQHTHLHKDGSLHSATDHSPISQKNLPYYQKLAQKTDSHDHQHVIIKSLPMRSKN